MQIPELLNWVYWHGGLHQVRDRTRNKMSKAITLYLCNCQQSVCSHPKERALLEDCKPAVTHIRKPGWVGYIHSFPWRLEGICADVVWVKSPSDSKTGELLSLLAVPQRFLIKDLIKLPGKLDKSVYERQQDGDPKSNLSTNCQPPHTLHNFASALLQ